MGRWNEPTNAKDPRNNPNHRERGPKRFSFTYADVARATGLSQRTARALAQRGAYDPNDLRSLAAFIHSRQS